jgi:hypothetical protein
MDKNKDILNNEINKIFKKIIYEQNIELLKTIAKDYNRNEKDLLKNYKNGLYK